MKLAHRTFLSLAALYMPTFATTQLHLPLSQALVAQSIGLGCLASLVPLFGALSDRIGRKPILLAALLPYLGLAYPLTRYSECIKVCGSADTRLRAQLHGWHADPL